MCVLVKPISRMAVFPLVQRVTFLSLGLSISAPPDFSYIEELSVDGSYIKFSTWKYLEVLADQNETTL